MSASRSRLRQPSAQATQTAPITAQMNSGTGTCGQGVGVTLPSSFLSCPGSFFSGRGTPAQHCRPCTVRPTTAASTCLTAIPPTPVPGAPAPDRHPSIPGGVRGFLRRTTDSAERTTCQIFHFPFSMLPKPFHPSTPSHHLTPLAPAAALTMRPPGARGAVPLGPPLGRLNHGQRLQDADSSTRFRSR